MRRSFCMALVLCCSVLSPAQEGDGNWFMAQTKQATVKSVIATSELVEAQFDGKYLYPPSTSWTATSRLLGARQKKTGRE